MVIIAVCGVLVVAGLSVIFRWSGGRLTPPEPEPVTHREADPFRVAAQNRALRRYAWWATVVMTAGVTSGVLMAGAGGRLVMRVLALTSPLSEGRITEALATVGDITLPGTFTLFLIGGLMGVLSAVIYVAVHRLLPPGRWAGLTFGLVLLVLFATTFDPLRTDNIDFRFVGPGWLAAALFSALMVLHGMLVAAAANWYSSRLPQYADRGRLDYLPLLAGAVILPAGLLLGLGAAVVLMCARFVPAAKIPPRWLSHRMVTWVGRTALLAVLLTALPTFTASMAVIVSGPAFP
ncbi:hypothetical protein [Arthrobacter sp. CAN_A1]|uniref:hypothetical protein n=1 Tax=Arthrobacter sp. CAN_A1 TaxID=2787717 RepID=UPI0018CB51F7